MLCHDTVNKYGSLIGVDYLLVAEAKEWLPNCLNFISKTATTTRMTGDDWIISTRDTLATRMRIVRQTEHGGGGSSPDAPLGSDTENGGLNHDTESEFR